MATQAKTITAEWAAIHTGPALVTCEGGYVQIHVGETAPTDPATKDYFTLGGAGSENSLGYTGSETIFARCPNGEPHVTVTGAV